MKEEALSDRRMCFGKPPYDIEYIRRFYRSSGLFDQQALYITEKTREDALKDLKMYFGEPPAKEETVRKRLSSGLLGMQMLAKYLITVDEPMIKGGYEVIR